MIALLFGILVVIGFGLKAAEAWRSGPSLNAVAWAVWFVASILWLVGRVG